MNIPNAPTCCVSLCVLLLLSACSGQPPKPAPPPSVIEVPVPSYRAVDDKLTAPIPEPAPPASNCTYLGVPAVCLIDALLWVEEWRGKLEGANTDRATVKTVTAPTP